MVTINWEREPGERIEDFVAAYLLLEAGAGNQIRPSQGDGGIDVQIPTQDGWDIYQVKRFTQNLGSSEKTKIRESWTRFTQTLQGNTVRSWNLVLPLEPTLENLGWLNELTEGCGVEINWIGRTRLDGWAANNPRLTDYFFGEGGQRWQELVALALSGARPLDGDGEPLLGAVQLRAADLGAALDEIDPFYLFWRPARGVRSWEAANGTPTGTTG